MDRILDFFNHYLTYFSMMNIRDVIDIICITVVLFTVYRFIRERRAGKLVLGIGFLAVFLLICKLFSLKAMGFILMSIFDVGIVMLVIVFQPELRAALEKMGDKSIQGVKKIGEKKNDMELSNMIDDVCGAIFDLAREKTGALIIFECNTKLGDIILTGTVLDAEISSFLIKNIFYDKAPLHDGAVIIRGSRISSAGCMLPLSINPDIIKDLGTRHRAAIGISENSDCVSVVVSEETGIVSIARAGEINRNLTKRELKKRLEEYLIESGKYSNKQSSKQKAGQKD